jgi:hypothetical protein
LIGNFPPYTRLKSQTEQIWVNMRILLHKTHNTESFSELLGFLMGALRHG